MLVLNKEKEHLLVEQYGFQAEKAYNGGFYYLFGGLTIYGASYPGKSNLKVKANSLSVMVQNKLYQLIKDDILLCIEETESVGEVLRLKYKIKQLENKIQEMESKNESNKKD